MITLEQIRLLESKITRALELIRVLKDENTTLRKGLESAQRRMRELETLVDGFKTDQKEIESVIVRTLHNLDELEESAASAAGGTAAPAPAGPRAEPAARAAAPGGIQASAAAGPKASAAGEPDPDGPSPSTKEELDIF
jgi:TolA-binding protein